MVISDDRFVKWPCDTVRGCKEGYFEAHEGDGLVMQRPSSSGSTVKHQTAPTIRTMGGAGTVVNNNNNLRIRYLTERECLRLMGQPDDAIDRLFEVIPAKTVRYKLAGNSIVVDCLEAIFKGIYIDKSFKKPDPKQITLGDFL